MERTVLGGGRVAELAVRKPLAQPGEFLFEVVGLRVDADSVADVQRGHEFFRCIGEPGATEVHLPFRVGVDEFLLAAADIDQQQADQVDALVAHHVDPFAVLVEPVGGAGLLPAAVVEHAAERAVFDHDDVGAAVRALAHGESHGAGEVGDPLADVGVVLDQQFAFTGVDVEAVDVVQCRVAVVDADDDLRRRPLWHGINHRADSFHRGQVSRRRHPGFLVGFRPGIDRVDVEVLGAAFVLDEQHVAAVLRPKVAAKGSLGVGRERARGVERLVEGLHPDVHHTAVGLAERNPLAVRGKLGAGDLRVAEEDVAIDEGRQVGEAFVGGVVGCAGEQRVRNCAGTEHGPSVPSRNCSDGSHSVAAGVRRHARRGCAAVETGTCAHARFAVGHERNVNALERRHTSGAPPMQEARKPQRQRNAA